MCCVIHFLLRHNDTYLYAWWRHTVRRAIMSHHMCHSHAHSQPHHLMKLSVNKWRDELEFGFSCSQTVQIRSPDDARLSGFCPNHLYAERGPQCLRKTSGSMAFCGLIWTLHPAPPTLNQHVMAQEHEHWSPTSVMMCEGVCVCAVVCCFNVCVADLLQNWQAPEAMYKNTEGQTWGRGEAGLSSYWSEQCSTW